MTYEGFGGGLSYHRVAHFSNPSINYVGNSSNPTGHAQDGDNARTMREMRSVLAGYRAAVVPPTVTLGLSGSPMAEAGGAATVTATLSSMYEQNVTVNLSFSGTASWPSDYTRSGTSIVIVAGNTTGTIELIAVQDIAYEGNETLVVDVSSVANGTENGTQRVTATITDDDPELGVTPSVGAEFVGSVGGVTSPSSQVYLLTNHGTESINWTASRNHSWVLLSAPHGTLSAGGTIQVIVSVDAGALEAGDYSDVITFSNTTRQVGISRTIDLTVRPMYIYYFPLDTDPGWARNGEWAFGQPTGQGNEGGGDGEKDPTSGAMGDNVFGVNLNGDYSSAVGGPYYLTAGPFDFSNYTNVVLHFERWLNMDYGLFAPATVDVSSNGTVWTQIYINQWNPEYDTSWSNCQYDVSSMADRQAAVYVRWGYEVLSEWASAESGWNIDDVGFTGDAVSSPDIDSDGMPNDWELLYFGGETKAHPDAIVSNGLNTALEAYIAGLDPTDPESFFDVAFTNDFVIRWGAVSGRVYSVHGSTNLLDGFHPLKTNILWPLSSWTDTVNRTESFYKLDVQLAE